MPTTPGAAPPYDGGMSSISIGLDSVSRGGSHDDDVARLRIPPHSNEAEQSVLGGLLLDNSAWDRAGDLLTDSDFYRHEHKLIYAAIGVLVAGGKPADVITVFEQLQSLGKSDDIGGLAYLNALAQSVPSAANIRRYAEIVRERAVLRKLVAASDEIATNAFNPQGRAVSSILDEAETKIFRIGEEGSRGNKGLHSMNDLVVQAHRPRAGAGRERRRGRHRRALGLLRPRPHDRGPAAGRPDRAGGPPLPWARRPSRSTSASTSR